MKPKISSQSQNRLVRVLGCENVRFAKWPSVASLAAALLAIHVAGAAATGRAQASVGNHGSSPSPQHDSRSGSSALSDDLKDEAPANPTVPVKASADGASVSDTERAECLATLRETVRAPNRERLSGFCQRVYRMTSCTSHEGRPIFHSDSGSSDGRGKRILVLGMIHGDEPLAGEMALEWETRLRTIDHRNSWRVIPMLNPDGMKRKTRMNANGVDLNRNFPTKDWASEALGFWKKTAKSDPRRFPGETPASEAETKCVLAQIKDFKPDFVVSVHTPYHVLDFDGPRMSFPQFKDLPWRALGNFPGSLGRLMWKDFQVPVLTVELGNTMIDAARLQDIVGGFAIEAARKSGQKTAAIFEDIK